MGAIVRQTYGVLRDFTISARWASVVCSRVLTACFAVAIVVSSTTMSLADKTASVSGYLAFSEAWPLFRSSLDGH